MGMLNPIEPLNSISLEVDGSNLHPCSVGGSAESKIALRAQDHLIGSPSSHLRKSTFMRGRLKMRRRVSILEKMAARSDEILTKDRCEDNSRLMDLRLSGRRRMEATSKAIVGIAWKMEATEMAMRQQECGSDTR
ncbi:hypothetical protein BHM03_00045479 [Ensete ventricosum]|nr:hypothetical protein BHM03_00045479 [Ensete ventricosum]